MQVDGVTLSGAAPVLDLSGTDFVVTESPTDDFDITLQDERIEDIIGTALTAGTQTDITVTYQDGTNDFDLVVDTLPNLTGTLDVNSGGTGVTTITDGGILLGSGTGAISNTGVLSNGQLLIGDGSGDPTVATLTQGTGITITNGAGSITVASTLGTAIAGSEITNNTIEEVDLEVTNSATDNYLLSYDSSSGGFTWVEGSSSNTRAVYLVPEYPGLTLVPDGSNNTGTMTSDFCSGTSGLSVNTSVCAASDNHNYFSWTTAESTAQDYDIFVRYKVPSDFSSFASSSTITMDGWRTDSTNNMVELALFDDTMTQCGTTTNVATGTATWSNVALGGDETGCGITAEEVITFRIRMTADQNDFARAGAIEFSYNTAW